MFLQIGTGEIQISAMPTLLKYANKQTHPPVQATQRPPVTLITRVSD